MSDVGQYFFVETNSGVFVKISINQVLENEEKIKHLLDREKCGPRVWRHVGLLFYRMGRMKSFESFLTRAVDLATLEFITAHASKKGGLDSLPPKDNSSSWDELNVDKVRLHQDDIEPYTTLAGYCIQKMFVVSGYIPRRLDESQYPKWETYAQRAEDLLRKAQLLTQVIAAHEDKVDDHRSYDASKQKTQGRLGISAAVLRGYLELAHYTNCDDLPKRKKMLNRCFSTFTTVIAASNDCVLGILGLAACHYACQQFREALELYASVMHQYVTHHVEIRLAIGFCQMNLKNYERAVQCFQRVLQLDVKNSQALLGLSLCCLIKGLPRSLDTPVDQIKLVLHATVTDSVGMLLSAFHMNPFCFQTIVSLLNVTFLADATVAYNVRVVTGGATQNERSIFVVDPMMSYCVYISERYELFMWLLQHGKGIARNRLHLAELAYQEARVEHLKNNLCAAEEHYWTCLKWMPRHLSAYYGLAQVDILQNRLEQAENNLSIILRQCPNSISTLKLYTFICLSQVERVMKTQRTFSGMKKSVTGVAPAGHPSYSSGSATTNVAKEPTQRVTEANEVDHIPRVRSMKNDTVDLVNYLSCVEEALELISGVDGNDSDVLLLQVTISEQRVKQNLLFQIQFYMTKYLLGHKCVLLDRLLPLYERALGISWVDNVFTLSKLDDATLYWLPLCHNLGVLYALSQQFEMACSLLDACLDKMRSEKKEGSWSELFQRFRTTMFFNRALLSEEWGDHSEAARCYKVLIETSTDGAALAWQRFCWMHLVRSDFVQSKKCYRNALKTKIPPKRLVYVLAEVYRREGKFEKAVKHIKDSCSSTTGHTASDGYTDTLLGMLYHRIGHELAMKTNNFASGDVKKKFSEAASYYLKALRHDGGNWYACNGLSVLLAEQNCLKPALDSFSLLLNASKEDIHKASSFSRVQNTLLDTNGDEETPPNLSPAVSGSFIVGYSFIRGICHYNLGLLHASIAMSEHRSIIPGQNIRHLDQVKVVKALKHTIMALTSGVGNPLGGYLQISRILHDACRFRESQRFLEMALERWSTSVVLQHNLAYVLGKAVMSEMQVEQYVSDTEKVQQWILDCQAAEALHANTLRIINSYSPLDPESFEVLRSYTLSLLGDDSIDSAALPDDNGKYTGIKDKHFLDVVTKWEISTGLPIPHHDLELLPSVTCITKLREQVGDILAKGLKEVLPRVKEEFEKRTSQVAILEAQVKALREAQENELRRQQEQREEQQRQQRLMLELQNEEKTSALSSLPSRLQQGCDIPISRESHEKEEFQGSELKSQSSAMEDQRDDGIFQVSIDNTNMKQKENNTGLPSVCKRVKYE